MHAHPRTPRRHRLLPLCLLLTLFASASAAAETSGRLEGTWEKKNYSVSGTWTIDFERGTLTLSDDFATRRAPDLKLFFGTRDAKTVTDRNATDGSILVSELRSNKGSQTYELPEGFDLEEHPVLILHCEKFSKLWAVGRLRE